MNFREELAEQIRAAWADAVYPGDENIGREEVFAFIGRDWRAIPFQLIMHVGSDMIFFEPESLAYYLPAYLLATIWKTDEVNTSSLRFYLSPWIDPMWEHSEQSDDWANRWLNGIASYLSPQQARALTQFFQNYLEIMGEAYWKTERDIARREAAIKFWTARADDPTPAKAVVPTPHDPDKDLNPVLRQELVFRVQKAFADMPYPSDARMGDLHFAEEPVKDWQHFPLGTLHWVTQYITHYVDRFTPEGFCFLLPAFMVATLTRSRFLLDYLPTGLLNTLCPPDTELKHSDWHNQVANLLKTEQKKILADYLRSFPNVVPGVYARESDEKRQHFERRVEFWTKLTK